MSLTTAAPLKGNRAAPDIVNEIKQGGILIYSSHVSVLMYCLIWGMNLLKIR